MFYLCESEAAATATTTTTTTTTTNVLSARKRQMFSEATAKRQLQMFSVAKAKRQLPSAQSERKSITCYGDEPISLIKITSLVIF
ncbi:hypothetical protein [Lysinibacillus sp. G4S2]|uniref:hypothetical protein n=1 Tax=Lysinibacillus sp. G4S2 TaxID=3055859 RepID=UPI0025A1D6D8|nr:hypothetical protein [Lysinibacillus sp. G4S2]MDM5248147.1 hypothetical protein [Lysinibacillus sp. G4S2]